MKFTLICINHFEYYVTDQAANSSPTQAVATFKIDFTQLYDTLCKTMKEDQITLLVYLLLQRNVAIKSFILSRTNIDQLVSETSLSYYYRVYRSMV